MPGRLILARPMSDVAEWFGANHEALDDDPRQNIAPGQDIVVWTASGIEHARWGMIPVGRVNARGRPVMETIINARSETVFDKSAFDGVTRGVVPADGWYEWTGERRRKTPWKITRKDGELMGFAAIYDKWSGPGGIEVPQVATVTCAPNADVANIHHRMGVILGRDQVETWVNGTEEDASKLMQPLPEGVLRIEENPDVNWDAP